MRHWEGLMINDEVHISGRGMILTVNLKDNKLTEESWVKSESPISVGDTLVYKDREYEVTNIEGYRNLLNGGLSHLVGLTVKEK